jgi:uncharacterized membrane protein
VTSPTRRRAPDGSRAGGATAPAPSAKAGAASDADSSEQRVGTAVSTARLEAFSDGVFAIAITILVISLSVPEIPKPLVATELPRKLLELWPGKLVSYVLSFVIVGMFWVAHHAAFRHIRRADRGLLWLNIFFLLWVSFLPFPTALLGQYFDQRLAVGIYALTLLVTGLALQGLWWYATSGGRLVDPDLAPALVRELSRKNLVAPGLALAALALAFVHIGVAIVPLLLVPVVFMLPTRVPRRRGPRPGRPVPASPDSRTP